jgi:hypothetical protein
LAGAEVDDPCEKTVPARNTTKPSDNKIPDAVFIVFDFCFK